MFVQLQLMLCFTAYCCSSFNKTGHLYKYWIFILAQTLTCDHDLRYIKSTHAFWSLTRLKPRCFPIKEKMSMSLSQRVAKHHKVRAAAFTFHVLWHLTARHQQLLSDAPNASPYLSIPSHGSNTRLDGKSVETSAACFTTIGLNIDNSFLLTIACLV